MTLNEYLLGLIVLAYVWYCGFLVAPELPAQIHEWLRRKV